MDQEMAASEDAKLQTDAVSLETQKIDIELKKLRLEKQKTFLTFVSAIILPIAAAFISALYSYATLVTQPRKDFLKLLADHPVERQQVIDDWRTMFPGDVWVDDFNSPRSVGPKPK